MTEFINNHTGSPSSGFNNIIWAEKFTGLIVGNVVSDVRLNTVSGSGNVRVKIYQDDGTAGLPSTLLAESDSIAASGGIQKFFLNTNAVIPGSGNVWAAFETDSGSLSFDLDSSFNAWNVTHTYGTGPSPFGTATNLNAATPWMAIDVYGVVIHTTDSLLLQTQLISPSLNLQNSNTAALGVGVCNVSEMVGFDAGVILKVGFEIVVAAGNVRYKVYADDGGGGLAGTLLGETNSVAAQSGMFFIDLINVCTIPNSGNFWLGIEGDNGSLTLKYAPGGSIYSQTHTYGTGPNPYTGPFSSANTLSMGVVLNNFFHLTDSYLLAAGSNVISHTTDSFISSGPPTVSHTTDSFILANTISINHTTDSYLTPVKITHTTDSLLVKTRKIVSQVNGFNASTGGTSVGILNVCKMTSVGVGIILKVSFEIVNAVGNIRYKVFADDGGTGTAGTLIAETNSVPAVVGINYIDLITPCSVSQQFGGNVWLGIEVDNGALTYKFTASSGYGTYSQSHTYGTGPTTFTGTFLNTNTSSMGLIISNFSHLTDSLLSQTKTLTHTTSSYLSKPITHTTDSYKLYIRTKTHTTDSLALKIQTKSISTDSYLTKTKTIIHTTDSYIIKRITVLHTTDSFISIGKSKFHKTDSLKYSSLTRIHTTDSLLKKSNTITHTTDSFTTQASHLTHTTNSYLVKDNFLIGHIRTAIQLTGYIRNSM